MNKQDPSQRPEQTDTDKQTAPDDDSQLAGCDAEQIAGHNRAMRIEALLKSNGKKLTLGDLGPWSKDSGRVEALLNSKGKGDRTRPAPQVTDSTADANNTGPIGDDIGLENIELDSDQSPRTG